MKLAVAAISDIGRIRHNNEDMLAVKGEFVRDGSYTEEIEVAEKKFLIAVADGMGGHNGGELASEFVLQRMSAMAESLPPTENDESLQMLLDQHIRQVHVALNQLGKQNPGLKGLGSTFTGILFHYGRLYLIHIGDSRLYRYRRQIIALLSKDHTLRNMLNDPSIPANKIANCFGGGVDDIFFDFEALTDRLLDDDMLLLCSDGLSGELTDDEITQALTNNADCAKLVQLAKERGGNDNISLVMISVTS